MTHRLLAGVLRDVLGARQFVATLLLLGLAVLGGCHGSDWSGSSQTGAPLTGPNCPQLMLLQVTPTNPSVAAGTSVQFAATGIYSDNSHADLTARVVWATSNTAVATVGVSTGKGLGVAVGKATVSASLQGLSAGTTLTVTSATVVSISITPSLPSTAAGTTEQFTATATFSDNTTQNLTADLSWTSSNTTIATVSSSGVVSAVGPGSTTISAVCQVASLCATLADSITLIVTPATLVSIAITPPNPSIALGTSETFTATGIYSDHSTTNLTTQVIWVSATPAVATVSNAAGTAGVAASVAPGTTLVTAILGTVTSTAVALTVTPATLVSIAITPATPSIALGTSETFTATGTYSDSSVQNLTTQVTWNSATLAVATISNAAGTAGVATSVAPGTTLVTAVLGPVTSTAVTFTVTPATLMSIAITPAVPSTPVTGTEQFIATGIYSDNSTQILTSTVTWASSDGSIASISNASGSQGLATGLVVGSTSISAAFGSVTASPVTLTVTVRIASVLYSFTGTPDGQNPLAGLIQATDGNFYGTTQAGGTSGNGTVFKVTPAGVETVLYSFTGGTDGGSPYAALIQATDGNFYGTTVAGGTHNVGTVFKVTPAGVETALYSFTYDSDGGLPQAALIQGTDGNFYGTTASAGTFDNGVVFKVTPAGIESVLYTFTGGNDGALPLAGLIQGIDGNFYGTTNQGGGTANAGIVFQVTSAGVETVLYSFTNGNDGGNPQAVLIQGTDGSFYGMTSSAGTGGFGTIFNITPAGAETTLYSFTGGNDGGAPYGSLIQGTDGNFYGTTNQGGVDGDGVVFKF